MFGLPCGGQRKLDVCGSCSLVHAVRLSVVARTVLGQPCPQFHLVRDPSSALISFY